MHKVTPFGLAQQADEATLVGWIAPEAAVYAASRPCQGAQQTRRTAIDTGFACQHQEGFEQQMRFVFEKCFTCVEQIADQAEICGVFRGAGQFSRFDRRQQAEAQFAHHQFVDQANMPRGTVVALHQTFRGTTRDCWPLSFARAMPMSRAMRS
jgi:hypothetical protein